MVGVEVLGGRAALAVLGVVGRAGPPGLAAEAAEERVEGGGEGAGGLAREQRGRVALGERVRVVARALPRPALARGAVEGPVGVRVAARLGAEDRDPGLLLGGAEREEVPVGAGDAAAVLPRAVALDRGGQEGRPALELPEVRRRAVPDEVRDVVLVQPRLPLEGVGLAARGAVAAVAEGQRAVGLVLGREGLEREEDGVEDGVVAPRLVVLVEGLVAEALVLGDAQSGRRALVQQRGEDGEVQARAALGCRGGGSASYSS